MRRGVWQLLWIGLWRDRGAFAFSGAGVALGVAICVFLVGMGEGIARVVREEIFPSHARQIEVVRARMQVGAFLGGGELDEPAVQRLGALPGVERSLRKMRLAAPAVTRYRGEFFGRPLRIGIEMMAEGVDHGLVEDGVSAEAFQDPGPGAEVYPGVLSTRLLEIYNHGFATARGLPQLDADLVVGFRFPFTVGASYVTDVPPAGSRTVWIEVVGVSSRAVLAGVTLPLETVRRWNARAGEEAQGRYEALVLEAAQPDQVPALSAAARAAGFELDQGEARLAEQIGAAVRVVTLGLSALGLVVLLFAALDIGRGAWARVMERLPELGLMRAVGARRRDLAEIILGQALVVGAIGAAAGVLLALLASALFDLAAAHLLPAFPFKPERFFEFEAWVLFAALGGGVVASGLGALSPALKAGRLDPVAALRGRRRG